MVREFVCQQGVIFPAAVNVAGQFFLIIVGMGHNVIAVNSDGLGGRNFG